MAYSVRMLVEADKEYTYVSSAEAPKKGDYIEVDGNLLQVDAKIHVNPPSSEYLTPVYIMTKADGRVLNRVRSVSA